MNKLTYWITANDLDLCETGNSTVFDKSTNWIFVDNDEDDDEYEDSEKSKGTCTLIKTYSIIKEKINWRNSKFINVFTWGLLYVYFLSDKRGSRQRGSEKDRPLPPLLARVNGQIEVRHTLDHF